MIISINDLSNEDLITLKTIIDEEVKQRDDVTFQVLAQEVVEAWNRLKEYDKYATFGIDDKKYNERLVYPRSIHSKGRVYKIK